MSKEIGYEGIDMTIESADLGARGWQLQCLPKRRNIFNRPLLNP